MSVPSPFNGRARQSREDACLATAYRLIAECLLAPDVRDAARISAWSEALDGAPQAVRAPLAAFLASPRAHDADEHLLILELTPPCPLYLGHYLFEEPQSCRGAGFSGRNGYMLEVGAVYRHFGFEIGGGELPDFLPAMCEFLAISLENRQRDSIGIRRRFVETHLRPGLAPMRAALAKYESPYRLLIESLEAAVAADVASRTADPIWVPPTRSGSPRVPPVVSAVGRRDAPTERTFNP